MPTKTTFDEIFTPEEQVLIIESVMTRIEKVNKMIPTFVLPELKLRYENDLMKLNNLRAKLNEFYFNNL